jgi:hypothetical protein
MINPVSPHPDLFPDLQFLLVVIIDPVHNFLFRSAATDAGTIIVVTAYQFARTGYRHGLVFIFKQTKGDVVQLKAKIVKVMIISPSRPSASRSGTYG